jgi:flotillin
MFLIAEGEKQKLTLVADGQAEKIRKEGTAEADIIRLKGLAEADAIRAKGLAEAQAMEKKALAWEMYGKAALTQLIVEQLPAIVGEASKCLQNTEKIIVMGEGGPSKLVGSVVDIAAQAPALVKSLTGMDIGELIQKTKELIK